MDKQTKFKEFRAFLSDAEACGSAFDGFDHAWKAFLKLADIIPTNANEADWGEQAQLRALTDCLSKASCRTVLKSNGLHMLRNLQPPLESVMVHSKEGLDPVATERDFRKIGKFIFDDPNEAVWHLIRIIRRIRNRKEHALKNKLWVRDREILEGAYDALITLIREASPEIQRRFL